MTDPTPVGDGSAEVAFLQARMRELQIQLLATKATNTLRAYRTDLRDFNGYCRTHGLAPRPAAPQTIARYLVALVERGYKPSTILRRRAAISMAHQLAGHRLPDGLDTLVKPLLGNL